MRAYSRKTEDGPVEDPFISLAVDPRRLALTVLAVIATIFALQWAQNFFIPLLLGILIAYTLNPLVAWLTRLKIPRMLATSLVLCAFLGATALATKSLTGQVERIFEQLPSATGKLSTMLREWAEEPNAMQKMQAAAREIEQATKQAADGSAALPRKSANQVVVQQQPFKLTDFLWTGSLGMFGLLGESAMVLFLVFFLLSSGPTFRQKLLRLAGPSLSNKNITVTILDDIDRSIQNYMLTLLLTNMMLGVLTWLVFRGIGLENAGAWALATAVLHCIPYVGAALVAFAAGMAAFMQFESVVQALLVTGVVIALATFIGTMAVTWMSSKVSKMNAAAIFIALLFWGWLWGMWGLLLAIPIMSTVKVLSDHIEDLQPVSELLSE
ncbi:MAG: AI-2E family transporter [Nitrospira sp.]